MNNVGIYGYIAAAVLAAIIGAGAYGYRLGDKNARADAAAVMDRHLAADRKAEDANRERIRQLEASLTTAQAQVSEAFEKGKKDAEATGAAVVAGLNAGNLSLRKQWASCETNRLSDATAATSEFDAAIRDRNESAARIVRAAAQCDAQVKGLQDLLKTEREHLNKH